MLTEPAGRATGIRVSDQERERATDVLGDAYAAGRLAQGEFLERVAAACSARTRGELADLIADLPERWRLIQPEAGAEPNVESDHAPKRGRMRLRVIAAIWLALAAAATHIAEVVPLILLALFLLWALRRR